MITAASLSDDLEVFHGFCKVNKLRPTLFWLVGSTARLSVGKMIRETSDLDILVTSPRWDESKVHDFAGVADYKKTGFGDWKVRLNGIKVHPRLEIDFLFGEVGRYLRLVPTAWDGIAIHLATRAILTTAEFQSPINFEIVTRRTRQPNYRPYYNDHLLKQGITPKE